MKRFWIGSLCLLGFLIAGRPAQAQASPSPQPATATVVISGADADFLASLQTPQASVEPAPVLWTSCNALQCKSNCVCGRGCHSFCNLTACTCGCQQDTTGGPPCQV